MNGESPTVGMDGEGEPLAVGMEDGHHMDADADDQQNQPDDEELYQQQQAQQ